MIRWRYKECEGVILCINALCVAKKSRIINQNIVVTVENADVWDYLLSHHYVVKSAQTKYLALKTFATIVANLHKQNNAHKNKAP